MLFITFKYFLFFTSYSIVVAMLIELKLVYPSNLKLYSSNRIIIFISDNHGFYHLFYKISILSHSKKAI